MPANLAALFIPAAFLIAAVLIGRILERWRPVEADHARSEVALDYWLAALNLLMNAGALLLVGLFFAVDERHGRGLIHLWPKGWAVAVSFAIYLLVFDLLLYGFHRAQHKVPMLWAMHSLHHSNRALTVSTGARHYWLEGLIKRVCLFPLMGFVFEAPPQVPAMVALLYFAVDSCAHMNLRLSAGRFTLWVNNPQYHRIHHSSSERHNEKNFSDFLPLWDLLFGTAWRPSADEWPATGLATGEKPRLLLDGLTWPLHRRPTPHPAGS